MHSSPLSRSTRRWLAVLALALFVSFGGCNLLANIGYVINGDDVPADCDKLNGKRIAVVCRPVEELQYSDRTAAPDLAAAIGQLLKANGKKIQIINPSDVRQWCDERDWHDFTEVGKGLKADMVIGIDLEGFSLMQGQTLYQGKADVNVAVYDMKDGGKKIWGPTTLPRVVFPPNSSLPVTDRPEAEFRAQFINVLAERIARNFYPHDPNDDFASDANALSN